MVYGKASQINKGKELAVKRVEGEGRAVSSETFTKTRNVLLRDEERN